MTTNEEKREYLCVGINSLIKAIQSGDLPLALLAQNELNTRLNTVFPVESATTAPVEQSKKSVTKVKRGRKPKV